MKKICLVVALLISSFLLFDVHISSASPDPTLREYWNTGDDASLDVWGASWEAQTFTVGGTGHTVTSIKLLLWKKGNPGIGEVSIRATDVDGKPTGSDLTSSYFDGNVLVESPSSAWYEFTVPEYYLENDTKYAIVIRAPFGYTDDNEVWCRMDTDNGYADGDRRQSINSGSSWGDAGMYDILFEIWGESSTSWWNEDWNNRIPILLEPHMENYQHRLFLDMTDNLGDNARSDFQDLRVISAENDILPIFRDNWSDDENAVLWYKKPENTYSYAWLYYGNASAAHVDNGDNVFPFFDNFDGSTLNEAKWSVGLGTIEIANSTLVLENVGTREHIYSDTTFGVDIAWTFRITLIGANPDPHGLGTAWEPQDQTEAIAMLSYDAANDDVMFRTKQSNVSEDTTDIPMSESVFHTLDIVRNSTDNILFYIDGDLKTTHTTRVPNGSFKIFHGVFGNADSSATVDWTFIRNYVYPEPAATLGNAEAFAPNVPPTTPTELTLNAPKVGENLIAEASGSTDDDGPQSITYYYRFYNQTDTVERQAYSTDNTYVIVIGDAHDNVKVFAKAYDGENYSVGEIENSIIVTNTPPTLATNWTNLGMNLIDHTPTVTWTEGTDNDGDTVTSYIYVGTTSTPTTEETNTTDETADLGSTVTLDDGVTYYYRFRSHDGTVYSNYTASDEFRMNTPPTIPTNYTNLGLNENNTPIIEWTKGTDAEGDTVTTFIYLDNVVSPTEVDNSTTDNTFTLGENESHSTYPLENGKTYYYRLRSWDSYEYSSYTTSDQFRIQVGITTLYPTDDSDVLQWMADTNRGSEVIFMVQTKINANARAFLKFDISVISPDDYILSATLQLYCYDVQYYRENISDIVARKVLDDNWSEENITWVNQPSMAGLASIPIEPAVGWMEWDITEYVDEQNEWGENVLSIALTTLMEDFDTTGRYAAFLSKEWEEEYKPRLVLELSGEEPAGFLMIITSTAGGYTIPVEDEYEHPRWTEVYLQAIENGAMFEYWEKTENEVTYRIYTTEFYDILWGDTQYHAVFFAPPGILEAMPTALAIAISLMFGAVGFGISKGNSTIGIMFLLLGIMMVSIFGLLPEWFFIVPLIAFAFFTLWKYSKREPHD